MASPSKWYLLLINTLHLDIFLFIIEYEKFYKYPRGTMKIYAAQKQ
jgi:hypothetical protein